MSNDEAGQQGARARMQAEQRLVVQATMQAKRSGKMPERSKASAGSEAVTAVVVIVVVVALLFLAIRYGA